MTVYECYSCGEHLCDECDGCPQECCDCTDTLCPACVHENSDGDIYCGDCLPDEE